MSYSGKPLDQLPTFQFHIGMINPRTSGFTGLQSINLISIPHWYD